MKKVVCIVCALVLLVMVFGLVKAENDMVPEFVTMGQAFGMAENTGFHYGDLKLATAVVKWDGQYYRLITEFDAKARELAYSNPNSVELDEYVQFLPVTKIEAITATPLSEEEIASFIGRPIKDLEEMNFAWWNPQLVYEDEDHNVVLVLEGGVFTYFVTLDAAWFDYAVADQKQGSEGIGLLPIKSIIVDDLSVNIANPKYNADGSINENFEESWVVEDIDFLTLLTEVVGDKDFQDINAAELVDKLLEIAPERRNEIQAIVESFMINLRVREEERLEKEREELERKESIDSEEIEPVSEAPIDAEKSANENSAE